jgi:hypothetical protein
VAVTATGERVGRIAMAVVCGLVLLLALTVSLPRLADGRFWSDGATYHAMAASLAFDGDLDFRAEDLARERADWSSGPQGVFLKRVGGVGKERLVYAKPLLYPLAGAPLVRWFGTDRGLLLLNAAALIAALWLAYGELRRRAGPLVAVAGTLAVFLAGVTPVYLLWPTPEMFNLALATIGLVAWSRGRPWAAAVALGLAVYAKPTNAALALPLLLEPLVVGWPAWSRGRLGESARRALAVTVVAAAVFGVNRLVTGEVNYQGGDRKTFYDRYPFDPGVTFDSSGVWMTTDHVGPLVAGRDEDEQTPRVAPPRSASELWRSFELNLGYFWLGRFGGALPYFPGVGLALLLFLVVGPRERRGWLALVALGVSWLGYILLIPDNWYGGAGTIGNRYFVNLVPLGLFLLPARWGGVAAAGGAAVTGVLLGPMLLAPIHHSQYPGEHATRPVFRVLPAELTMLGDLSVFEDVWRKRRPYNAPGGDPSRRPPGAPPAYFLWFLDDGSFGQESAFGQEGFWLRGGTSAEIVLQAIEPPPSMRFSVTAGPAGDVVSVRVGRARQRLVLAPLRRGELVFERPSPALGYYGTSLFHLRLSSRLGKGAGSDRRRLGSFVEIVLGPSGAETATAGAP